MQWFVTYLQNGKSLECLSLPELEFKHMVVKKTCIPAELGI